MASKIFRPRVNRHVDAAGESREAQRRRPGVVHEQERAVAMCDLGDRVEKNGGRTIDRRVDGADVLVWIAAEVRDRRRRFDVRFVVHAVERRLAAICATCTATDWRMSMTSASRGSSSVAN